MSIKCDLQLHYFWFKHQDLWYTNKENGANLGSTHALSL